MMTRAEAGGIMPALTTQADRNLARGFFLIAHSRPDFAQSRTRFNNTRVITQMDHQLVRDRFSNTA